MNTRGIDIVKNLKWRSVSQRRDYFMSILMFKSIHGLAPDYMCEEINMQCDIAERSTRSLILILIMQLYHMYNIVVLIMHGYLMSNVTSLICGVCIFLLLCS